MSTRIKICGLTRVADALAAVAAGADALGFIFYDRSPRYVAPEVVASITRQLPPLVTKVGVFVNAPAAEIRRVVQVAGLDIPQLHGEETPEFCARLGWPVIKAFRLQNAAAVAQLASYPVAAWLLDAFVPGLRGGTGAQFNWEWAIQARAAGRPVILAGGLTPDNVAEAVRTVRPYAVDVSSGVETAPGQKDIPRLQQLIRAVRAADLNP
jgi:phosphoribosylanthranilate isomerase